ncbi:hypothetical protein [Burkholderia diffusa]|uniref:hypothetical protein n=1 Tax=Burkholderia diffusa TaxID=488732 RepID=UPI00157ABB0E|nr:hypothetical protein [Burkholderia diffusa]
MPTAGSAVGCVIVANEQATAAAGARRYMSIGDDRVQLLLPRREMVLLFVELGRCGTHAFADLRIGNLLAA